jgi:hypothetical protein
VLYLERCPCIGVCLERQTIKAQDWDTLKLFAFVAVLVLFGVWLLLGVVRPKYYLLIKTFSGTKKIVFQDSNNIAGIRDYVAKAQTQFGYKIKVST